MKVVLFNGSPNKKGCTYTALAEIEKELNKAGIETEIFQAGLTTKGCLGCGYCKKNGKCITDDCVNQAIELVKNADGFVFGSPVHYAAASGMMTSFLDRLFMTASACMKHKPCAVATSCRRAGSTAALEQLIKYPEINQMPIITSQYWNMVHGNTPEEVAQDLEGLQTMRIIGKNMAWILKCIEAGKNAGIDKPEPEEKLRTNYIR